MFRDNMGSKPSTSQKTAFWRYLTHKFPKRRGVCAPWVLRRNRCLRPTLHRNLLIVLFTPVM